MMKTNLPLAIGRKANIFKYNFAFFVQILSIDFEEFDFFPHFFSYARFKYVCFYYIFISTYLILKL